MANAPQKGPTNVRRVTAPEPPPATVQTRFAGTLQFNGGYPTDDTVQRLYDQIDFQRGCQVFLRHLMAAAVWGFRQAFVRDVTVGPTDIGMLHLDANGLLLTGNSETIYGTTILGLKPYGPMVVDVPPRVLGLLNDQWMRPLGDVGLAGPDHGKGGRYLLVPPGYDKPIDETGFVAVIRPRTYRVWYIVRAFLGPGGDPAPAFETHRQTKIYPLDPDAKAPATQHVDLSGKSFDTIHPTDIRRSPASARPTPGATATRRDSGSTRRVRTGCACRVPFPRRTSGRSSSTTCGRARCSPTAAHSPA
jgi:hypothetical protein